MVAMGPDAARALPVALPAMTEQLSGRVALVTGASRRRGIGFAIADQLTSLGADVAVHAWRPYDAAMGWGADADDAALLTELRRHGTRIERLHEDLRDPEGPERLVAATVERFGTVDMLVANHTHSVDGALGELTADHIDEHFEVNVRATLLVVQAFAAQRDGSRPGGRVVMLTSGAHLSPMGREIAYAVSKGALAMATWTLADVLADRGVTVNTVNPGPTDTGWADPEVLEAVAARFPAGRWGQPEDAARLIAWLCTDDAAWVTGQVIDSEGGFRRW